MRRIMIVLLALVLLIPATGCGGRLASRVKEARNEQLAQFVSFDEPADARILFRDNFEDGDLDGWQTTGLWTVEQDGEGQVLVVTGSAETAWVPEGVRWTDHYVRAGVKLESGGCRWLSGPRAMAAIGCCIVTLDSICSKNPPRAISQR